MKRVCICGDRPGKMKMVVTLSMVKIASLIGHKLLSLTPQRPRVVLFDGFQVPEHVPDALARHIPTTIAKLEELYQRNWIEELKNGRYFGDWANRATEHSLLVQHGTENNKDLLHPPNNNPPRTVSLLFCLCSLRRSCKN